MNMPAPPLARRHVRARAALARLLAVAAHLFERPRYEHLDNAALRDLGVGRPELGSFEVHALGATTPMAPFDNLHRGV